MSIKSILIYIILVSFSFLEAICAQEKNWINKSSFFEGYEVIVNGDSLYKGIIYNKDFSEYNGYFDRNFNVVFARKKDGANNTFYFNYSNDFLRCSWQSKNVESNRTMKRKGDIIYLKEYHYDEDRFYLSNVNISLNNVSNKTYKRKGINYCEILDYDIDRELLCVCAFLLFCLLGYFIFRPIANKGNTSIYMYIITICVIGSVVLIVFVSNFILQQLLLPILSFSVPFFLSKYIKNKYVKHAIHCGLCAILLFLWGYFQFVKIEDYATLSDGKTIPIRWKTGTSVLKRIYFKKVLRDMIPQTITSGNDTYVIYVNKYEFSEPNWVIMNNNELFGTLTLLRNKPIHGSYCESMLMLEYLSSLSGIEFDLLNIDEFLNITNGLYDDTDKNQDITRVTRGKKHISGLVNLRSNIIEYTSSYFPSKAIGLAGDTLISTYEDVCITSGNVVNKCARYSNVGFRLVYRPDDINKKHFRIIGIKRNDIDQFEIPHRIELTKINDIFVNTCRSYEAFQDILCRCRFETKIIEGRDINFNPVVIEMPKGYEWYDFIPEFSYECENSKH